MEAYAIHKNALIKPRLARMTMDLIRGKDVETARGILENTKNKSIAKNNTSGISGVSFHKKTGKWQVKININKKEKYFGIYDSFEEAKIKRLKLEIKYYGEFAPNKELYERYGLI